MSSTPPLPVVLRGEIWEADFDPVVGHEQGRRRPCLVISDNRMNRSGMELVVVVLITTSQRELPSRIPIAPPEGGLPQPSDIMCQHIRTISKRRLLRRFGNVTPATMTQVQHAVRLILALDTRP